MIEQMKTVFYDCGDFSLFLLTNYCVRVKNVTHQGGRRSQAGFFLLPKSFVPIRKEIGVGISCKGPHTQRKKKVIKYHITGSCSHSTLLWEDMRITGTRCPHAVTFVTPQKIKAKQTNE